MHNLMMANSIEAKEDAMKMLRELKKRVE